MIEERKEVKMTVGEYGITFEFTIYDSTPAVVVLAGSSTVTAKVAREGEAAVSIGTGSVYNAAGGVVRLAIALADAALLSVGRWRLQVTVSSTGQVLRPGWIWLVVEEALA
jgi:hypothetical protein